MSILAFMLKNPDKVFYGAMAIWWLGGALTVFVPVIKWHVNRSSYYDSYGRYNQYQNAQQQQNGQQNNYSVAQSCSWYQWGCRKNQYNYIKQMQKYRAQNGDGARNQYIETPGWYNFLGGRIPGQDERELEEMGIDQGGKDGGVKFVYGWSIILFISLLVYGSFVMYRQMQVRDQLTLSIGMIWVLLATVFQYSLLLLVLVPQGVITTDDSQLEDDPYGWFGQFGFLLAYFQFSMCLFTGIAWTLLTAGLIFVRRVQETGMAEEALKKFEESEMPPSRFKKNRTLPVSPTTEEDKKEDDESTYDRMM